MVVSIIFLLIFYLREHFAKQSSKVNSYLGTSNQNGQYKFFDLHAAEQLISFETFNNYHPMENISDFLDFSFYHVTQNSKDNTEQKIRLTTVPCTEIIFQGKPIEFAKDCIRFTEKTEIGYDPNSGVRKQIFFEVQPCRINCPANMGQPNYVEELEEFLTHFVSIIRILDSTANFKEYSQPFKLEIGGMMETMHHAKHVSKKTFMLGQTILTTKDGFLLKTSKEDKTLIFKDSVHSYSPRLSETDLFSQITIELSTSIEFIERIYPIFVDMISDFGGLVQVLVFTVYAIMSFHHLVIMEQYLINESILLHDTSDLDSGPNSNDENRPGRASKFSYLEIAKYKFCRCKKKGEDQKHTIYKNITRIIS